VTTSHVTCVVTFECVLLTGQLSQLSSTNATSVCDELSTVTEQSTSDSSLMTDRQCSSAGVSHILADVKLVSADRAKAHNVSHYVNPISVNPANCTNVSNSVNVPTRKDLPSSSVVLPAQTRVSSAVPVPQHQTKTSLAASGHMMANDQREQSAVQPASYSHCAETGRPTLELTGSSTHPVLPNQTVPFKVISYYLLFTV